MSNGGDNELVTRKRTLAAMRENIANRMENPKVAAAFERRVNVRGTLRIVDRLKSVDCGLAEELLSCIVPVSVLVRLSIVSLHVCSFAGGLI